MDINSSGFGWTYDGNIIVNSDNRPIMLSDTTLVLNMILFHLLTEPGSYAPNPNIGLGLLKLIGQYNLQDVHQKLETEINAYFASFTQLSPYRVRASVHKDDQQAITLSISILGPNLAESNLVLLEIQDGRITKAETFLESAEELPESIVEVRSGETENPYLARLNRYK